MLAVLMLCAGGLAAQEDWKAEVQEIDGQIEELQNQRVKLLGRATQLEDNAVRWQFMPDQNTEARRAYRQADIYRQQADELQGQIDRLEQKKQKILEEHTIKQ